MAYVFVVSHNNAREGAPRLCAKLAVALHRRGWYEKVFVCALREGACPEAGIPAVGPERLARQARALLERGKEVRLLLSTVISTRLAGSIRSAIVDGAGVDGARLRIVGLVHEVRNETFSWVRPKDLSGLDAIAFVARYTADSYGPEYAPGLDRAVIHNWLSPRELETADAAGPGGRRKNLVLCVGVVAAHKGQLLLAEAFRRLRSAFPQYRMAVVGHVYDEEYAERIRRTDPAIEVTGAVPHGEVLEMMKSCGVFLHGSPMESCCLSIMEAMYCRCPVVAARVGGVPEEITDGADGLLYEPGDAAACSALLARLAESATLRRALGEAARRTVAERFLEGDKLDAYRGVIG